MNWRTEAIEKLRKYDAMRQAVMNLPEEIRRLESVSCSLRSATADATPVQGGGSRREEMLLDNIVQRQELQRNWEQAKSWVCTVENALRVLTPAQRQILLRMYVSPENDAVTRLTRELGLEQSSIYRHRDRALYRFTTALYGITESVSP